jgi:hypothetical protein
MNTEAVAEASRATLAGTIPFPEVVRRLIETGVEYYHVDYMALRKTFYSAAGELVMTPINCEKLPAVAAGRVLNSYFWAGKLHACTNIPARSKSPPRRHRIPTSNVGVPPENGTNRTRLPATAPQRRCCAVATAFQNIES